MKFGYSIIYVEDVMKTVAFYNKAFGFKTKMITPEQDYAELNSGETTIAFANLNLANSNLTKGFQKIANNTPPVGIELAFITLDIDNDLQVALDNGAKLLEPITQKPWGQKVAYIQDINGVLIELCQEIKK